MQKLIWLNDYNLNFNLGDDASRVFIFDEEYLTTLGAKRLQLIYTYLAEQDIRIFKGNYLDIISDIFDSNLHSHLVIPSCPCHHINAVVKELADKIPTQVVATDAVLFKEFSSKRFFPYWNKVKSRIKSRSSAKKTDT